MPNPPADRPESSGFTRPGVTPAVGIDDDAFETVGQTVRHAAGALEGLRDILERLEFSITKAVDQRRNEEQIGELFIRAQEYVDRSIAETEERARIVVAEAEIEAGRIISVARDEARRLIEEGKRSTRLPADAVRQLQATIDGFGHVNRDLLRELTALSQTLGTEGRGTSSLPSSAEDARQPGIAPQGQGEIAAPPAPTENVEQPGASESGYWSRLRRSPASPTMRVQQNRLGGPPR
jgi:hypothetical protein